MPLTENATSIFSQVTQGNRPVKNAEVTATIEGVGGDSFTIPLWDNGAGADLIANDGVYSRFFYTTDNDTFYTVSCHATSYGGAEVLKGLVNQVCYSVSGKYEGHISDNVWRQFSDHI